MFRFGAVVFIAVLLISSPALAGGNRYAIVVGVGRYPPESHLNILSADSDAVNLSTALRKLGWSVTLLNALQTDINRQPTQENLLRVLGIKWDEQKKESVAVQSGERFTGTRSLGPSDTVLFYFGGHGITDLQDQDNLVPLDTIYADGRISNPEKLIQLRWVRDALRATQAGTVVLIIDACREGAGTRSTPVLGIRTPTLDLPPLAQIQLPDVQRTLIFKSTGIGKWAHEMQLEGTGVFTNFLLKVLTDENVQKDANRLKDGQLTFQDVIRYVSAQTSQFVSNLPPSSKKGPQEPYVEGDAQLDFVMTTFAVEANISTGASKAPTIDNLKEVLRICAEATNDDFKGIRDNPPILTIAKESYQGKIRREEFGWTLSFLADSLDDDLIERIKVIFGDYPVYSTSGDKTIIEFKSGSLVLRPRHMEFRAGDPQSFLNSFKTLLPSYAPTVRVIRADMNGLQWVQVEEGKEVRYTVPIRSSQGKRTGAIGAGATLRNSSDLDAVLGVIPPIGTKVQVVRNGSVDEDAPTADIWYIESLAKGKELAKLLMSVRWSLGY